MPNIFQKFCPSWSVRFYSTDLVLEDFGAILLFQADLFEKLFEKLFNLDCDLSASPRDDELARHSERSEESQSELSPLFKQLLTVEILIPGTHSSVADLLMAEIFLSFHRAKNPTSLTLRTLIYALLFALLSVL